jgi:hypothetical protein
MLFARPRAVAAAAASTRWSGSAAAQDRIVREIRGCDDWRENEKKDQCVHEQRRNDPFPALLLAER